MYKPGDLVLFTTTNPALNGFSGEYILLRMHHTGHFQLKCGNIMLLARADELNKI
jgi:hypothetical protein